LCGPRSRAPPPRPGPWARRAADVVEPELVAERDRLRLPAVLAADPGLQAGLRRSAALDADAHQLADTVHVERLEGVVLEDAVLEIEGQELALRVVAREAERRLRQIVGPEREEIRVVCDLVRSDAGPRELDHRAAEVLDLGRLLLGDLHRQLAQPAQLLVEGDEGMHDLDQRRLAGPGRDRARGADDRTNLHLVDLRPLQAEPAAARPEHRVRLLQLFDAPAHVLVGRLLERREELVPPRGPP